MKTKALLFISLFFLLGMQKIPEGLKTKSSEESLLSSSNASVGFSLYERLKAKPNLFFSPYSISSSLYMIYFGARDKTAAEIKHAIKLPLSQKDLPNAYKKWNQKMLDNYQACSIYSANSGWTDKATPVLTSFNTTLRQDFSSEIKNVDFFSSPSQQLDDINHWIAEKTNGNISNVLPEGSVTPDTVLLLVNAIYFQAPWAKPFSRDETHLATFYSNLNTIQIPMMHQTASFPYFEEKDYYALILPLACERFGFVVLLPKHGVSLASLSKIFSEKDYMRLFEKMELRRVDVKIPKFSINFKFLLNDSLKSIGIRDAFRTTADFSGMNGRLDLYITNVFHQAILDIDENGVLATSATASSVDMVSAPTSPPVDFHVNRPFIFFISDLEDKSLLFLGKMEEPSKL